MMQFKAKREDLLAALASVAGTVGKGTIPILGGVLVEVGDTGAVSFTTTDLTATTVCALGDKAEGIAEGKAVFPCRVLEAVVKSMDADADISVRGGTITAGDGRTSVELKTLPPGDFPMRAQSGNEVEVRLVCSVFAEVALVHHAASQDDAHPALTGVLIEVEGDGKRGLLRAVATDSYRVAVAERKYGRIDSSVVRGDPILSEVFPSEMVARAEALIKKNHLSDVLVGAGEGFVSIEVAMGKGGTVRMISRKIEAAFPKSWRQVIPKEPSFRIPHVNACLLTRALGRIKAVGGRAGAVRFEVPDGDARRLSLHTAAENGVASDSVGCGSVEGAAEAFALNVTYALDATAPVAQAKQEDFLDIEVAGAMRPVVFRNERMGYVHVVMPVRLQ